MAWEEPASLHVVLDAKTHRRLLAIAAATFDQRAAGDAEKQRQVEELAENAISEAALDYFRDRGMRGDPD